MQSISDFLLLSARKQLEDIEAGDEVEIDFDSGMIYDHTKGTSVSKDRPSRSLCRRSLLQKD